MGGRGDVSAEGLLESGGSHCLGREREDIAMGAIAGSPVAREALLRIQRIFEADEKLKGLDPDVRKRLRDASANCPMGVLKLVELRR